MNPLTLKERAQIRVLLISGQDPVADWMAEVIKFEQDLAFVGLVRDLGSILSTLDQLEPDVILVDVNSGILNHGDLLSRLTTPISRSAVIVVAMKGEVEIVREAMLHGAQGFLLKPFREEELISSVRQAYELLLKRRTDPDIPQIPAGQTAPHPHRSEIISVYSPKGGVGCTTVAINLAVALKVITGQSVTLVDGDLRFGDIDIALNITSGVSIVSLLSSLPTLDDQMLEHALTLHKSGVRVLTAPLYLDAAETIRPSHLARLLHRLSGLGNGHVVVDTWSVLDDCTLALLDASRRIVIVTTPQVTALRDTHRCLEVLRLLEYDMNQVTLVLNNCYQRTSLKLKEVERALGYAIDQTIDYAPQEVSNSLNRGVPLVQEYRSSPAAQSIYALAELLAGGVSVQPSVQEADDRASIRDKEKKRGRFQFRLTPSAGEADT